MGLLLMLCKQHDALQVIVSYHQNVRMSCLLLLQITWNRFGEAQNSAQNVLKCLACSSAPAVTGICNCDLQQ